MKFLRRNWRAYKRIGAGRKSKQKWRRPRGRHNKMREKIRGKPARVSIGYRQKSKNEKIIMIMNVNDAKKIEKGQTAILGKIGKKNKIEIAKIAKEKGIKIANLNVDKFLKKNSKKNDKK